MKTRLTQSEVLGKLGLRIPKETLAKLKKAGIESEAAVTATRAGLVSGFESGGAVAEVGAYCSYVAGDGSPLPLRKKLQSMLGWNGKHAFVVAPLMVRIQIVRAGRLCDLLISKHYISKADATLINEIIATGRGLLDSVNEWSISAIQDRSCPRFCDNNGELANIPASFQSAVVKVVCGSCCVGCQHNHLLSIPEQRTELQLTIGMPTSPSVEEILADLSASAWIKQALLSALERDPVDAANDAELLSKVLEAKCQLALQTAETNPHTENGGQESNRES